MNVLYCIDYNGEVDDGWSVRWWWVDPIVDVTSHTSVTFPKSWWKLRSPPAVDQMEKYQTGNFPKSQIHQIQIKQKWTKSNFAPKAKTTTLDLCPQFSNAKAPQPTPGGIFERRLETMVGHPTIRIGFQTKCSEIQPIMGLVDPM